MGDILAEKTEALVNTVNCVGVMGRGIALQFKRRFPENFKMYVSLCKSREMKPGQMFVFDRGAAGQLFPPRYVINFPTKRHWRGKSRIEDIESGLESLVQEIRSRNIRSIAIPPLGAGLGGLGWEDVRIRVQAAMQRLDEVQVVVFEPGGGPTDEKANRSSQVPAMTLGRAALVALLDCYLRVGREVSVTTLEVHKLMYFLQVTGQPLRLAFTRGHYGPYAENLRHVLNAVEGHLVSGFVDGGETPHRPLELVPGAVEDAQVFLKNQDEILSRIARVLELVEGFETSFGLELLATVHWLVTEEATSTFDDLVQRVSAWSEHKKQFSPRQLRIAVDVLTRHGWIAPLAGPEFPQPVPVS